MTVSSDLGAFCSVSIRFLLEFCSFAELDACLLETGWKAFTLELLKACLDMIHLFLVCEFEFWSFACERESLGNTVCFTEYPDRCRFLFPEEIEMCKYCFFTFLAFSFVQTLFTWRMEVSTAFVPRPFLELKEAVRIGPEPRQDCIARSCLVCI